MAHAPEDVAALLPLPLATFHILLALAEGDSHGYGIIQDVAARTGGELKLERRHPLPVDPAPGRPGVDRGAARAAGARARRRAAPLLPDHVASGGRWPGARPSG